MKIYIYYREVELISKGSFDKIKNNNGFITLNERISISKWMA